MLDAANELKAVADMAEASLAERNRRLGVYTEEDSRTLDNEADRAWGGLRGRLQSMAMLDHDKYPRAKRSGEIEGLLFAEGSEFLKADYPTQGTRMSALLRQIDEDNLQADIDDIAGVEFLQAIRNVQPRYEAMVSERLRRDKAMGENLADIVRALQSAIVAYSRRIVATIDDKQPATLETARLALLPITNFREEAARAVSAPIAPPAVNPGSDQSKPA